MRTRTQPRLVAGAIVLAAAALFGTTGCAGQAAAVRVGDEIFSDGDLHDELRAYRDNDALWQGTGQTAEVIEGRAANSYDQAFVTRLVQQRVIFMLVRQVAAEQGIEITDRDREAALEQLESDFGAEALDGFGASYRDTFVDDVATVVRLQDELGDDYQQALIDAAADRDIEVSTHYGRWNPDDLVVDPPAGPANRAGDTGATGGPAPDAPVGGADADGAAASGG